MLSGLNGMTLIFSNTLGILNQYLKHLGLFLFVLNLGSSEGNPFYFRDLRWIIIVCVPHRMRMLFVTNKIRNFILTCKGNSWISHIPPLI